MSFVVPSVDMWTVITSAIRIALAVAAFMAVLEIIRGWFLLQTHGGNEDNKAKANATFHGGVKTLFASAFAASMTKPAIAIVAMIVATNGLV